MTKEEFIQKAKEHNYSDKQIKEFEDLRKETEKDTGYLMPYDKIILVDQAVY